MADGKQPQSSAETQTSRSPTDLRAKEELLRKAKEKFASTDVGGDSAENSKDSEYRQQALSFVQKECLNLPNDRFNALVEKIAEILKRKDLEKTGLFTEFTKARAEILNRPEPKLGAEATKRLSEKPKSLADMDAEEILKTHGDILQRAIRDPDLAFDICTQWGPSHPERKKLAAIPGGNDAILRLDVTKNMIEMNFQLTGLIEEAKRGEVGMRKLKDRIRNGIEGVEKSLELGKRGDRIINLHFGAPLDPKYAAEGLAFLANGKNGPKLGEFLKKAEEDPRSVVNVVCYWNENHPVISELRKMGEEGGRAIRLIQGMRKGWTERIGVQISSPVTKEERTKVEKLVEKDGKTLAEIQEWKQSCENMNTYLSLEWNNLDSAEKDGRHDEITKRKGDVVSYAERKINPRIEKCYQEIGKWPVGHPNRTAYEEILTQLRKRKLAANILVSTPWGRDGLATAEIARSVDGGKRAKNIRAERNARAEAFSRNLGNGKEPYMVTFDSKTWGNQAISFDQIEKELKQKNIQDNNPVTFSRYLESLHSTGMLTADHLKSVFGDNLFRAATNFGFKEDGTMDSGFGKSKALEMLAKGDGNQKSAASAFRKSLKQAIEERINRQRMLEVGGANGYPRLKTYMESKGIGEKFERLGKELDGAKSGLEILHALRKALGPEISDPVALEKFLKELPNIAKDVTKDREEHERAIGIDLAWGLPKGASLRILRISPVALRLPKNGDDAKFLEKVLEKNFGGNRDALEPEEEARVRKIIQKSIDAKKISPENLEYFKKLVELMDKRADLVTREKVTSQTKSFVEDRNAQEKGKAAVASPEDEKKQKEANGALMVGGEARQEAARLKEMLSELTDEERESVNQIVREHLKYSSIEEILADDHKINEAWGLFVNIENKCAALPGKDLTKSLLQTAFVSMTKRKVAVDGDEWYVSFATQSTQRALERNESVIQKLVDEGKVDVSALNVIGDRSSHSLRQSASQSGDFQETRSYFDNPSSKASSGAFLDIVPVGEKIRISDGYVVERTATGVAFSTPDGKWKVDGKAAEGAIAIAKTMHEVGADFLISSIKNIANSENIGFQDGMVSRTEERKLFVFMADFFGVKSFDRNEPDAEIMREKFVRALGYEGRSLKEKGRDIGIVSESGSLIGTKLQERLAMFHTYHGRDVSSPERKTPKISVAA